MKEKDIAVDVVPEQEVDLDTLFEQYSTYSKMESEAKKRKEEIKKQLEKHFEEKANTDSVGNCWLETTNGYFKKEIRKREVLNSDLVDPILRRLMIFDKVVTYEPVYDLDKIKGYIADGTISDDIKDRLFNTEVSYAIKTQKKKASK